MSASSSHTDADSKVQQQEIKLLDAVYDNYGGVIIKINEPMDPNLFVSMLKSSISHWKNQGKKGVWIKLSIRLANLVEPAVKEGFWFHHAEPSYLMLVNWIPGGDHALPANASHRVGVGAFVFNEEKRELLVVQESRGRYRGKGWWKIPTGVVDEGEDICDAAEREVKEETSIEAKFVEVLAFRQSHQSFFGKSDLFILCFMRPKTFDVKCEETELEAAQWMALEEYMKLPYVQNQELTKYIIDLGLAKLEGSYNGFSPVPTTSMFSDQKYHLYLNTVDLKRNGTDKNLITRTYVRRRRRELRGLNLCSHPYEVKDTDNYSKKQKNPNNCSNKFTNEQRPLKISKKGEKCKPQQVATEEELWVGP